MLDDSPWKLVIWTGHVVLVLALWIGRPSCSWFVMLVNQELGTWALKLKIKVLVVSKCASHGNHGSKRKIYKILRCVNFSCHWRDENDEISWNVVYVRLLNIPNRYKIHELKGYLKSLYFGKICWWEKHDQLSTEKNMSRIVFQNSWSEQAENCWRTSRL